MRSVYLSDVRPEIDAQISAYVEEKGEDPWGSTDCFVGIIYQGIIYRRLIAEGLTEWASCDSFLLDLGLQKLPAKAGYDALFEIPQ